MDNLKRKNILIVIFIITTVIASILAIYFAIFKDSSYKNNESIVTEEPNNNEENTQNSQTEINEDNTNENVDPYANYKDFEWMTGNSVDFPIIDGPDLKIIENKLYIVKGDQKEEVPINGTVKCIKGFINGGTLASIYILTNEGKAFTFNYEFQLSSYNNENTLLEFVNAIKLTEVLPTEKILEIYIGGFAVPHYGIHGPYFLTDSGKLINSDGMSYEEVAKNHILKVGTLGDRVYINSDATVSFHRANYDCNDVLISEFLNSGKDQKLKIKYLCHLSNRDTNTTFYAIGQDNKLYSFDKDSFMVANIEYDYEDKDVSKLQIIKDSDSSKCVQVVFTDGTTFNIKNDFLNCDSYYDFNKNDYVYE